VNPAHVNPARVNPARVNPARVNPARVNPARVNPAHGLNFLAHITLKYDNYLCLKIDGKQILCWSNR